MRTANHSLSDKFLTKCEDAGFPPTQELPVASEEFGSGDASRDRTICRYLLNSRIHGLAFR